MFFIPIIPIPDFSIVTPVENKSKHPFINKRVIAKNSNNFYEGTLIAHDHFGIILKNARKIVTIDKQDYLIYSMAIKNETDLNIYIGKIIPAIWINMEELICCEEIGE
jgi:hypothetical protein